MSEELDAKVHKKYDVKQKLGKGAYGVVWRAVERKTGKIVALKKIFDAFQNDTDAQRTFREIMFLQEFSDHENVIKILNVHKAENDRDIYLAFEYMDTDLNLVIQSNLLSAVHKRYVMYQIFKCLRYIHSGNVIHRDMKPSNVLLNGECLARVADFGLARSVARNATIEQALTDYVATRWYRSPEILLGSNRYTKGVDMWSAGCIMAELLIGKPLFPGASTPNQMDRIMEVLGRPSTADIRSWAAPDAQGILDAIPMRKKRSLEEMMPLAPPEAVDLLRRLFNYNPNARITAEEALAHPYVAQFRDPKTEPTLDHDVIIPLDDYHRLSMADYRTKLYEHIVRKKKQLKLRRLEKAARLSRQQQQPGYDTDRSQRGAPTQQKAHDDRDRDGKGGPARSAWGADNRAPATKQTGQQQHQDRPLTSRMDKRAIDADLYSAYNYTPRGPGYNPPARANKNNRSGTGVADAFAGSSQQQQQQRPLTSRMDKRAIDAELYSAYNYTPRGPGYSAAPARPQQGRNGHQAPQQQQQQQQLTSRMDKRSIDADLYSAYGYTPRGYPKAPKPQQQPGAGYASAAPFHTEERTSSSSRQPTSSSHCIDPAKVAAVS
eukprot:Opistho-2@65886